MIKKCIDCKKEFSTSNNRPIRCIECQKKYRIKYDKDKKRDKRDYKTTHSRVLRKRTYIGGGYHKESVRAWKDEDGIWQDEYSYALKTGQGNYWEEITPSPERIEEYNKRFGIIEKDAEDIEQQADEAWVKYVLSCEKSLEEKKAKKDALSKERF